MELGRYQGLPHDLTHAIQTDRRSKWAFCGTQSFVMVWPGAMVLCSETQLARGCVSHCLGRLRFNVRDMPAEQHGIVSGHVRRSNYHTKLPTCL